MCIPVQFFIGTSDKMMNKPNGHFTINFHFTINKDRGTCKMNSQRAAYASETETNKKHHKTNSTEKTEKWTKALVIHLVDFVGSAWECLLSKE